MALDLIKYAYDLGISIEYLENMKREAFYYCDIGVPPVICLNKKKVLRTKAHFRSVLSHEIGHYFTFTGQRICAGYFTYWDKLHEDIVEYRAAKWAAEFLVPDEQLKKAFDDGVTGVWEQADRFEVDDELMAFRRELYHRKVMGRRTNKDFTKIAPRGAFGVY